VNNWENGSFFAFWGSKSDILRGGPTPPKNDRFGGGGGVAGVPESGKFVKIRDLGTPPGWPKRKNPGRAIRGGSPPRAEGSRSSRFPEILTPGVDLAGSASSTPLIGEGGGPAGVPRGASGCQISRNLAPGRHLGDPSDSTFSSLFRPTEGSKSAL